MNVIEGFGDKMTKYMQTTESAKVIVDSLIGFERKTNQGDKCSNVRRRGRKWLRLKKLTELKMRVPN